MLKQLITVDFKALPESKMNDALLYTDYLSHIKDFEELIVDHSTAYKYQGNFYGLLKELGVNHSLFVLTMYVNGLVNPLDYDGVGGSLRVAKTMPIPKN